jgi:DNA polymerase-4
LGELQLTALAGVAPNKFLAKIASDWRKPDGLFVIRPKDVEGFLVPPPVGRIPGVGRVMEARLKQFGVSTVGDLLAHGQEALERHFGRYGIRLHQLSHGVDHSPVVPDRPSKSISAEDTFERDIPLAAMDGPIQRLAEKVWNASRKDVRVAKTVVLKLKTSDFKTMTRSLTPVVPPEIWEELAATALTLKERVHVAATQRFRLVGVGVSNFRDANSGTPCQRLHLSDSLSSESESLCSSRS